MKGKIRIIAALVAASLGVTLLAACNNQSDAGDESALRGTFTYKETINEGLSTTNKTPAEVEVNDRQYLFSNVYPINYGNEGTPIAYGIDQRLKLNRDYTYKYDYTILISNPRDWGGSCARLVISITGTFTFSVADEDKYSVLLSDPTGGTQTLYGATITSPDNYNWAMHSQPDLSLDYSLLSQREGYVYNEYVRSRVVAVDRTTKVLTDDVFYPEILNYIALYSTY